MSDENKIRPRDLDKVQEKKPVFIEPKHIFWAVLSLLCLLAIAFVAGFMVGKSRASEAHETPKRTVDHAQTNARNEQVPKFQRNGVRLASVLPVPLRHQDLDFRVQASARREAVEVQENKVNTVLPPNDLEGLSPFYLVAVTDADCPFSCGSIDRSGCDIIPFQPPKPDIEPKQSEQEQKILATPQVARTQHAPLAKKPTYAIQVRSYKDRDMASKFQEALRQKGYSSKLERHVDEQGNEWFRVMVGRFDNISRAKEFAKSFNSKENESAIVVQIEEKR
jgi:septal ring-binding cell division protein DamX